MIKPWGWQITQVLQGLTALAQDLHLDLIIHMTLKNACNSSYRVLETFFQPMWRKAYTWYTYILEDKMLIHKHENKFTSNHENKNEHIT